MLLKVTYRDGREEIVDSAILYLLRYKIIKFEELSDFNKNFKLSSKSNDIKGDKWRLF